MTASQDDFGCPRILLVEDSDIDAELICIHLDRAGLAYELTRARRRAEFDRAIEHDAIDLILADYSLPDFDGLVALEIAKKRLPNVPVVFVSGIGGEDIATDALRRGATDYVVKHNLQRLPGSVTRALAETRERLQRQQAEAALVKSEANMRLALDAATLGLWQYRSDGCMGWDDRCRAMLGIEAGQRAGHGSPEGTPEGAEAGVASDAEASRGADARSGGMPYARFLDMVHGADREGLDQAMQAALQEASDAPLAHECRFPGADGEVRWIVIRGRRLGADSDPLRMTGVMQDVTSTRTLESRQRHAEVLFKIAAQATGLGIWEIGPGRDQVWVDEGYRGISGLGAGADRELSAVIAEVVHPDDAAALHASLAVAIGNDGDGDIQLEHRLVRATDREIRWVDVKGRRIVGMDGLNRLVGTVRDVTEQRRLQKALVESNEELERRVAERTRELTAEIAERGRVEDTLQQMQRLEAVGQLTSGVAHDFNNLLTVVLSNISLIKRLLQQQPTADDRVAKRLDSMREAANRGATLTRQLLAFSRRQRLEPQSVSFSDILLGMRDLLQTTLGGSVHLETDLADDAWPALVDPTQMELIILNLAINARDAMEVGGSLKVATSNVRLVLPPARPEEPEPGEYVALSVSDTGTGMSDDVLAKAFEPFFTTKQVGKGSGLGLAQVFGFAKQSGGGVKIDTKVGEGTTVHVYMPRSRPAVHDGVEPTADTVPDSVIGELPASSLSEGQGRTVLLVDDDSAVREATAAMLQFHGYRVEQATDGAAALQRLRDATDVDLVMADFAMPRMNGGELAAAIRLEHAKLPIIFVTGYADLSALKLVSHSSLLEKPVAEAALVERVREMLKRPKRALRLPSDRRGREG